MTNTNRAAFEAWLRTVCFQAPTPEAYDLAKSAWQAARAQPERAALSNAALNRMWLELTDARNISKAAFFAVVRKLLAAQADHIVDASEKVEANYNYDKTMRALNLAAEFKAGAMHLSAAKFWEIYGAQPLIAEATRDDAGTHLSHTAKDVIERAADALENLGAPHNADELRAVLNEHSNGKRDDVTGDAKRWRAFRARDEFHDLDYTAFQDQFREDADTVIDAAIAASTKGPR